MTLDEWRVAGRTFVYRGQSVFYRDEGAGDVVLCIHGFPTASWDWHPLWRALTARFRVIAPDMMGFGFSAKPRSYDYSIHDQATLHESLLHALDVDRVHVLAHDYGDTVAQELLARHDERRAAGQTPALAIRSLCLLNGGLFPETHRPRLVQRLLISPLGPVLGRLLNERSFGRSFRAVFGAETQPSDRELRDFWTLTATGGGPRVAHKLIRYMAERRRFRERWVGALQHTAVPLRVIDGADDPVSGRHMVERYRQLVPHPDVVLLEDIGHYPQVEAPDAVLQHYLAFVERHAGAATATG